MSFSPDKIAASPELRAHLRLMRSDGIGPASFNRLLSRYGTATEVTAVLEAAAKKGTAKTKLADKDAIEKELETSAALDVSYLFIDFEGYPLALAETPGAPIVLTVKGNLSCLTERMIGVVGARNCSAGGIKLTRAICGDLADNGFTVVSGMARGIDTAAHKASLHKGTVACLAGGVDVIYPSENAALYNEITETGLIISEMSPGTKPQARHFPRRNRIISGLSQGLLIVEAAQKSGSLITANFAAEQNRDVFAVPGSPLDPRAQGCNRLIQDGAVLVQSAEDIIREYETMPLLRSVKHQQSSTKATAVEISPASPPAPVATASDLLSLLSPSPIHIDELVRLSGRPASVLLTEFTELEITGDVIRHPGSKYSRISMKNE